MSNATKDDRHTDDRTELDRLATELIAEDVHPMPPDLALTAEPTFRRLAEKIPDIAALVYRFGVAGEEQGYRVTLRPGLAVDVEAAALGYVLQWRRGEVAIRLREVPNGDGFDGFAIGMVAVRPAGAQL